MRIQGRITEWNDPRGFGFITPLEGGDRVFAHVMAFPPGNRRPSLGEYVSFDLGRDEKGRFRAERATYVVSRTARSTGHSESRAGVVTAGVVSGAILAGIAITVSAGKLPLVVLPIYIVCSIGAYFHYRSDKGCGSDEGVADR
jgi:cold shock CspA family protein